MNTVLAYISCGLFGWLGYTVWTESYQVGYTGKARALGSVINATTERYGTEVTSIFLFSAGIILAFVFLIRATQEEA